jgi:hypothetical protein
MKVTVFQDVKLYRMVDSYHVSHESAACIFRVPSTLKMDVAGYYKMLVTIYQTTWHHIKK